MDAQDCINAIEEGMDRIKSEDHIIDNKNTVYIGRAEMSYILTRSLSEAQFKSIARIIKVMRGNKQIIIPRQDPHSDLMCVATVLNCILPMNTIFIGLEE